MLITFFRSIVLYIVVLIVMRLMGKREIGQLQPFELAISIMIADLAATPMAEEGVPITNGIMPILGLLVMHLIISMINIKSNKAREIICGKPSLLIFRGKIDEKTLKKERFTINELEERLRDNNIFFLRHPEGVMFSHLQDYREELKMIYGHVCTNDDPQRMEESINRLTDPFDNSICEKCANVKKAFLVKVADNIASNYYISGAQGEKKGISLDRTLVEWECEL